MPHSRALALACVSAALAFPASLLAAPTATSRVDGGTWTSHYENVLGTSLDLRVRAASQVDALRAERALLAEFDRQSAILSAWDANSEFSRWQRTRHTPVKVSPELLQTLARFDRWQTQTDGLLNPAVADAAELWQAAAHAGARPTEAALRQSARRMQRAHWSLDPEAGTATRLTDTPLVLASFTKSQITAAASDAALRAGATGVMLNVGGDIVVRGAMTQRIAIANPSADAENAAPLDTVLLRDRVIATSGGYRRNVTVGAEILSHLIDPRSAEPAGSVLSATVISSHAQEAGALATALAIASPTETSSLLRQFPSADALIVYRDGTRTQSKDWARLQEPQLSRAVYAPVHAAAAAVPASPWAQGYNLTVKLDLPRIEDPRYRRPYIAVWIEDESKYPVRTLALWFQKPRWLSELKTWYRDDQVRNLTEGTDLSATISSATRGPGSYTLQWDGKDDAGKLVKPGKYTVYVEGAREHGGYGIARYEMDFNGKPQQTTLPNQPEIGTVQLQYGKK